MTPDNTQHCEDGVAPHLHHFQLAIDGLNFRRFELPDPMPLGRQILAAAGLDPRGDLSLFAILPSGDFEDIRLDEPFDLRGRGVEKLVAFHTDRNFKLTLNGQELSWGKPVIRGAEIYKLANVSNGQAVFLEVRGGADKLVSPQELIDLTAPGIERFITAPIPALEVEIIVNARPYKVSELEVTFEQLVQLAFPGYHDPSVIEFSITYRKVAGTPPEGELGTGGVVKVKNGSIFNVTRTDKS